MPTGYQIKNQGSVYFLTLRIVDWIDVFTRPVYKDIIIDNLKYCQQNKGFVIFAYVIMTNHIHLLAQSSTENMSGTLRDFKSYTSKVLLEEIENSTESRKFWMLERFKHASFQHSRNSQFQFWDQNNHPEIIYSGKFILQKLEYIHKNPVRAGIVVNSEDYLYSSARNYAGLDGPLEITVLSLPVKTIR